MRPSDSKCNRCGDAFRQGLITAPIVGLNSHSVFARLGAKGATAFPSALNWRRASMTYRPALFLSRATNCYPPQARRGPARPAARQQILKRPVRRARLILAERRAARLNQIACRLPLQRLEFPLEAFHPFGGVALCIAIRPLVVSRHQRRPNKQRR